MASYANIIAQIRANAGIVSQGPDSFDDTALTNIIANELVQLSIHLPKRVLSYVTSVAGQQEYTITSSPPDYVLKVFDVATGVLSADAFVFDDMVSPYGSPALDPYTRDPSLSFYLNPSLWHIFLMQLKALRNIINKDFTYERATAKIRLMPVPTSDGVKYYYIGGYTWPIADLPAHYEPILLKMAEAEAMICLAAKLWRLAGTSSAGAQQIHRHLGQYTSTAQTRKDEAIRMINQMVMIEGQSY